MAFWSLLNKANLRGVGKDKWAHFGGSAVGVVLLTLLLEAVAFPGDKAPAVLLAIVTMLGIGLTKEAMDLKRRGGSGFSEADIRADVLGVAVGAAAALVLV